MHKHIILFFSVLIFLIACGGQKAPVGIIPQPQMISLLTDIHLADGDIYAVAQVPDSLYKYGYARYAAVFKRYRVSSKQFNSSLKYYSTQPEELSDMYTKIAANIQSKIDSLTKSGKPKTNNVIPPK